MDLSATNDKREEGRRGKNNTTARTPLPLPLPTALFISPAVRDRSQSYCSSTAIPKDSLPWKKQKQKKHIPCKKKKVDGL